MQIQERLFALQDETYRAFSAKLTPTLPLERFIGVRVPMLRALAKELKGTEEAARFLQDLPHTYYEENNLHGLFICAMKSYDEALEAVEEFLPYVDNWATCDMLCPKVLIKRPEALMERIKGWIRSDRTYTVRFGLELLMNFYLDKRFTPEVLELAASVKSEEYYVNMMIAWFFATALAKQYDSTLPYLTERRLSPWTHNKTIQKAIESYRIAPEEKDLLRSLRI